MAEAFGVAGSAIQVADAGFKLYGALSQYVRDYVGADKHAGRLADEIRTTSWALNQLGNFLQQDEKMKLCKPEVISETQNALDGCQKAFVEVEDVLKGYLPDPLSGPLAAPKRLKWPFKKSKALLLLAQFERLKTTLLLVFKVLSYASKLTSQSAQDDLSLLDEKTQVTFIANAKRESIRTGRRLVASPKAPSKCSEHSSAERSTSRRSRSFPPPKDSNESSSTSFRSSRGVSAATILPVMLLIGVESGVTSHEAQQCSSEASHGKPHGKAVNTEDVPSTSDSRSFSKLALTAGGVSDHNTRATPKLGAEIGDRMPSGRYVPRRSRRVPSTRSKVLASRLSSCISAVAGLDKALDVAKRDLQERDWVSMSAINKRYRSIKRALDSLANADRDIDSEPDRQLGGLEALVTVGALQRSSWSEQVIVSERPPRSPRRVHVARSRSRETLPDERVFHGDPSPPPSLYRRRSRFRVEREPILAASDHESSETYSSEDGTLYRGRRKAWGRVTAPGGSRMVDEKVSKGTEVVDELLRRWTNVADMAQSPAGEQ